MGGLLNLWWLVCEIQDRRGCFEDLPVHVQSEIMSPLFYIVLLKERVPSQNSCVLLFHSIWVRRRNQEITEKFPALLVDFFPCSLFNPRPPLLWCYSAHIPVSDHMTLAHMMRIGTIKELTTVTHDHNLQIWNFVASHVLYQWLYQYMFSWNYSMFVFSA